MYPKALSSWCGRESPANEPQLADLLNAASPGSPADTLLSRRHEDDGVERRR